MKILVRYWLKLRLVLGLGEGKNKKMREAWKQSWRGVVWEEMKFCSIWRNIVSFVICYFESSLPII